MKTKAEKFELHSESEETLNKTTLRLDSLTESMLLKTMKEESIPTKVKAVTQFIHRYHAMKKEIADLIKERNQLADEHKEMYEIITGFTQAEEERVAKLVAMENLKEKHKERYKRKNSWY